ncbi:MAG: hypothetical protein ACOZNI_08345 [Myxococcota bacterium]
MHRLQELVRLHRQGTSAREAARLLGMSRNTVGAYLTALAAAELLESAVEALPELAELKAALPANLPPQQSSSIEAWAPRVRVLLAGGAQARGIYDLLRTTEPEYHLRGHARGGIGAGEPLDVLIAGDDAGPKELVAGLVRDGGLVAIDAGPLHRARQLEALGLLGMTLQVSLGTGFGTAWKLIRPTA